MKLPNESSSSEVLINYATYTAVRVAANQDTSQLAAQIIESYEALEAKVADRKKKTKESASKLAIRDEKEDRFDGAVQNLSLELLSVISNNRENVRYKSLFSKTPSSISNQSVKDKKSDVNVIIQKLNSNGSDDVYNKHQPLLQTALTELEEADKNYGTALENEQISFDFEKLAQIALRNILVKTYGKLIDMKGKKDADKYFKKSNNKKKNGVKENGTSVTSTEK